jgi:hypothetical protein
MKPDLTLITLAFSLLGTLIVAVWRFASLAATLLSTIAELKVQNAAQDARMKLFDDLAQEHMKMSTELEYLKKNHSLLPKIMSRLEVIEVKVLSVDRWRWQGRGSVPDKEDP